MIGNSAGSDFTSQEQVAKAKAFSSSSTLTIHIHNHNHDITMGKSLRNKKKVAARTIKRTDSFYAVAHAARLQRLSQKLTTEGEIVKPDVKEDEMKVDGEVVEEKEVKDEEIKREDGAFTFPFHPNPTLTTSLQPTWTEHPRKSQPRAHG
jgi:hypothetical protein